MATKHRWTAKEKSRIEGKFHEWIDRLNLLPMHVSFDYVVEEPEDDSNGQTNAFYVECGYPYRSVCLTVYPTATRMDDDYLELCLIHEAVHAVLIPMQRNREAPWGYFKDNLELVTDHLAYYIHSAAKAYRSKK